MNMKGALAILIIGMILGWLIRGASSLDQDRSASVETSRRSRLGTAPPDEIRENSGRTRFSAPDIDSLVEEEHDDSLLVHPDDVTRLIGAKVKPLEERLQLIHPGAPLEQIIGVTDNETGQLNELWNRLKPALDSHRADHVIHQELDGGGIWFAVEPFPEDGEALRKNFLQNTIKTLGEARARIFLNATSAHKAFGQWGKSVGSGFAVHTFVQEDDSLIYEIYEDSPTAGKRGRKWNSSTIPPHLKKLVQSSNADLPGRKSDQ